MFFRAAENVPQFLHMRCKEGQLWEVGSGGVGKVLNCVEKEANRKDAVYLIFPLESQIRKKRFLTPTFSRNFGPFMLFLDTSLINL